MSRYTQVTDELLSAYLDNDVTSSERALVETAVADDPEIAWRLATLQYTVNLLGKLPEIQLPRSFALTEALIAEPVTESAGVSMPAPLPQPTNEPEEIGFWQAWRSFWQGGNVLMRNAAAASFAAFLVLTVAGSMFSSQEIHPSQQADLALSIPADARIQSNQTNAVERSSLTNRQSQSADIQPLKLSPPSEPVPLPAASAEKADSVAMVTADESAVAPLAERASASVVQPESITPSTDTTTLEDSELAMADSLVSAAEAEPELIEAAALMVAEAPQEEEEESAVADEASIDAAPEESAATANADEPNAISAAAPALVQSEELAEDQEIEESAEMATFAATSAEDETSPPVAMSASDETVTEETAVEETVIVEAEIDAIAESAPAESAGLGLSTAQTEAAPAAAISVAGSTESDPIRVVQIIALGLTLLFAVLWLLSRRAKPTPTRP